MIPNNSPWIKQLNRSRPVLPLDRDIETDLAIVGGGIAGVVTAYFALKDTRNSVVLIEADKVAHGATGHNAGQLASYFERPLPSMVEEFGEKLATDGIRDVESAWLLLDEIVEDAKLSTPIYRFTGYAGVANMDKLVDFLESNKFRKRNGVQRESIMISESWDGLKDIPEEYAEYYSLAKHKDILDLLDTNNSDYIACVSYQKGCTNSALFTEELVGYLSATYKERFAFFEESPLKIVRLNKDDASLEVLNKTVNAKKVVLCTNGFENFSIDNNAGHDINTEFHHSVAGRIGYMAGYVQPLNHPPTAISYFSNTKDASSDPTGDTYFYLTRRPHENEGEKDRDFNLICAGGPEKVLPNGALYSRAHSCDEEVQERINDFLLENYGKHQRETEYAFCWHGLMGYTPNGVRMIGPEPLNPVLVYNLGCNGVGILPSIFGGKKISRFLNGENMEPSIFDPRDQSK